MFLGAITFDLTFPWWNVPHLLPVTFFWCWTWRKITFWPLCLNSIGTSFRKTSLCQVWPNYDLFFFEEYPVKISSFQTLNIFQKIIIPFEYWVNVQIWLTPYEIPCRSIKLVHFQLKKAGFFIKNRLFLIKWSPLTCTQSAKKVKVSISKLLIFTPDLENK